MLEYLKDRPATPPMTMPMVLKDYDIWIGNYSLGQGYSDPDAPQKIATVKAASFGIACLKYELGSMMTSILAREVSGEYIDQQSCRWFYNYDNNSNSWTGLYFETEEDAWKTFSEADWQKKNGSKKQAALILDQNGNKI